MSSVFMVFILYVAFPAGSFVLFEDEGHFLVNRQNRIALQEAWLRFLETQLH